jgi:hypothetical protein
MPTMKPAAILVALLLAAPVAAHAAKIYKWTDPQGNVIYSDTPRPGAIEMDVPTEPAGIVPVPPQDRAEPDKRAAQPAAYDRLSLLAPTDGQIVQSPGGWVDVSVEVAPALNGADGHDIRLRLDGQTLAARHPGTDFSISVPSGQHTLQAEVVDRAGAVLITSAVATITVQEPSAQAPAGPDIYPPTIPGQPYPPTYNPPYPPQPYPPQGRPKPQPPAPTPR